MLLPSQNRIDDTHVLLEPPSAVVAQLEEHFLMGDKQSLLQVVRNVVANAVKMCPCGKDVYIVPRVERGRVDRCGAKNGICSGEEHHACLPDTCVGSGPGGEGMGAEGEEEQKVGGGGGGRSKMVNVVVDSCESEVGHNEREIKEEAHHLRISVFYTQECPVSGKRGQGCGCGWVHKHFESSSFSRICPLRPVHIALSGSGLSTHSPTL